MPWNSVPQPSTAGSYASAARNTGKPLAPNYATQTRPAPAGPVAALRPPPATSGAGPKRQLVPMRTAPRSVAGGTALQNIPESPKSEVPELGQQLNAMTIAPPLKANLVPSVAPAPSCARPPPPGTANIPPSYVTSYQDQNVHPSKQYGWFQNGVCVLSPYKRNHFDKGDVISFPYHIPNLNRNVNGLQREVAQTDHGPVFTQRRMAVILYKTQEYMFCLPFFSWQQTGIDKKMHIIDDYVCVAHWDNKDTFRHKGPHKPLLFVHKQDGKWLTDSTTCHIAGGGHGKLAGKHWVCGTHYRVQLDKAIRDMGAKSG